MKRVKIIIGLQVVFLTGTLVFSAGLTFRNSAGLSWVTTGAITTLAPVMSAFKAATPQAIETAQKGSVLGQMAQFAKDIKAGQMPTNAQATEGIPEAFTVALTTKNGDVPVIMSVKALPEVAGFVPAPHNLTRALGVFVAMPEKATDKTTKASPTGFMHLVELAPMKKVGSKLWQYYSNIAAAPAGQVIDQEFLIKQAKQFDNIILPVGPFKEGERNIVFVFTGEDNRVYSLAAIDLGLNKGVYNVEIKDIREFDIFVTNKSLRLMPANNTRVFPVVDWLTTLVTRAFGTSLSHGQVKIIDNWVFKVIPVPKTLADSPVFQKNIEALKEVIHLELVLQRDLKLSDINTALSERMKPEKPIIMVKNELSDTGYYLALAKDSVKKKARFVPLLLKIEGEKIISIKAVINKSMVEIMGIGTEHMVFPIPSQRLQDFVGVKPRLSSLLKASPTGVVESLNKQLGFENKIAPEALENLILLLEDLSLEAGFPVDAANVTASIMSRDYGEMGIDEVETIGAAEGVLLSLTDNRGTPGAIDVIITRNEGAIEARFMPGKTDQVNFKHAMFNYDEADVSSPKKQLWEDALKKTVSASPVVLKVAPTAVKASPTGINTYQITPDLRIQQLISELANGQLVAKTGATAVEATAWEDGVAIMKQLENARLAGITSKDAIETQQEFADIIAKDAAMPLPEEITNVKDMKQFVVELGDGNVGLRVPLLESKDGLAAQHALAIPAKGTEVPVMAKEEINALDSLLTDQSAAAIDINALGSIYTRKDGTKAFIPNGNLINLIVLRNNLSQKLKLNVFSLNKELSGAAMKELFGELGAIFTDFIQKDTVAEVVEQITQEQKINDERIAITVAQATIDAAIAAGRDIYGNLSKAVHLIMAKQPAEGEFASYKSILVNSIKLLGGAISQAALTDLRNEVENAPEWLLRQTYVVEPENDKREVEVISLIESAIKA